MASVTSDPHPAVGFYFSVSFSNISNNVDSRFKEVSGITMSLDTMSINPGGDSGVDVVLPKKTSFTDLTLKRGYVSSDSALRDWCYSWLLNDYSEKIEKKDVFLKLLNAEGAPLITWQFVDAFPIKMEINSFNSMSSGDSAILMETIVLKYSSIKIVKV
jgi:phage tail-like protein